MKKTLLITMSVMMFLSVALVGFSAEYSSPYDPGAARLTGSSTVDFTAKTITSYSTSSRLVVPSGTAPRYGELVNYSSGTASATLVVGAISNGSHLGVIKIVGQCRLSGAGTPQAFEKWFRVWRSAAGANVTLATEALGFTTSLSTLGGSNNADIVFSIRRTGSEGATETQGIIIDAASASGASMTIHSVAQVFATNAILYTGAP